MLARDSLLKTPNLPPHLTFSAGSARLGVGSESSCTRVRCDLAGHVDFAEPRLVSVAAAHNVSAAQVALRWIAQQDIPFAVSPGLNEQYAVSLTPAQQ
jgi:hypothetical protein